MALNLTTRIRYATLPALAVSQAAHASALTPDCALAPDSLNCRLQPILHFLYGAAGVLALVLIIVLVAAIRIYQKNKSTPRDRA